MGARNHGSAVVYRRSPASELLLCKLIPDYFLGMLAMLLCMLVSVFILGVPYRGSLLILFFIYQPVSAQHASAWGC